MAEVDITLTKEKYRRPGKLLNRDHVEKRYGVPPPGTWVYSYPPNIACKARTNQPSTAYRTVRPRKRAYGPF